MAFGEEEEEEGEEEEHEGVRGSSRGRGTRSSSSSRRRRRSILVLSHQVHRSLVLSSCSVQCPIVSESNSSTQQFRLAFHSGWAQLNLFAWYSQHLELRQPPLPQNLHHGGENEFKFLRPSPSTNCRRSGCRGPCAVVSVS